VAADDASGRRFVTLAVASLTLLLPLALLVGSAAPLAPPLSMPPSRAVVVEPSVTESLALDGGAPAPRARQVGTALLLEWPPRGAARVVPPPAGDPIGTAREEIAALVAEAEQAAAEQVAAEPAAAEQAAADVVQPVATPALSEAAASIAIPASAIVAAPPVVPPVPSPTPRPEAWTRARSFNFVALGVDQRTEGELTRTDTLMLGTVDVAEGRVSIVSIPRDLVVEIPGYGYDRINSVYVYGEQYKEPDGGIGLLKRTIERNFGVPIHHHGLVDFNCFRTAIDSVGGVTIDVPRTIDDPYYPTEDYGHKRVHFDAGIQWMDGERALEYARTRYADNDFGRIRRQQLVVAALRTELLSLRSLPALPSMVGGCRNMRSDLGWIDYVALAGVMRGARGGAVELRAIDEQMAIDTTLASGASVLVPRWEPIRALIRESFEGRPSRPTTADLPPDVPAGVAPKAPSVPDGPPEPPPSYTAANQPRRPVAEVDAAVN